MLAKTTLQSLCSQQPSEFRTSVGGNGESVRDCILTDHCLMEAAKDLWEMLRRDLGKLLRDREHREELVKIGPTLNEKAST